VGGLKKNQDIYADEQAIVFSCRYWKGLAL